MNALVLLFIATIWVEKNFHFTQDLFSTFLHCFLFVKRSMPVQRVNVATKKKKKHCWTASHHNLSPYFWSR